MALKYANILYVVRFEVWVILLLASLIFPNLKSFGSDDGYRIKFQIKGISDSVCYLANYYGDKTYLDDTAVVDKTGKFTFESDSMLPGGVYIVAGEKNNKYLEFIINNEPRFSVVTDVSDLIGKVKLTGSRENEVFYKYINANISFHKKTEELKSRKRSLGTDSIALKKTDYEIDSLGKSFESLRDGLIKENKDLFVSVLLKAMTEPPTSYLSESAAGIQDSILPYQAYKKHYWDNFDLTDERLLRSPLFHKRMQKYFEQVLFQHPDTISKEADLFIAKLKDNKEVFKYVVWYLTFTYETSKIMGFDEIFVHMADRYYATGQAFWADSATVKSITKRADELRPILIGNSAPNLILLDTASGFKSLYQVEAKYTIVLFYEIDCGHCQNEIHQLKPFTDSTYINLQVFAVCTDTSLVEWKKFIVKNNLKWLNVNGTRSITPDYHQLYNIRMTPTLFLLDENKKIIAKRLKSEQLIPFIENYEKSRQPVKNNNG